LGSVASQCGGEERGDSSICGTGEEGCRGEEKRGEERSGEEMSGEERRREKWRREERGVEGCRGEERRGKERRGYVLVPVHIIYSTDIVSL
jgi:hypothetical protein